MLAPSVDVVCPKCRHKFQLPLGEALTPLIDGEIERRLGQQREETIKKAREAATKDSDERNQMTIAIRDKVIADMRVQIDELRRKVDLGSQQMQGEVQELALEAMLRTAFPADRILPVAKGRLGADTMHEVMGNNAMPAGAILWGCKHTKVWSNGWLAKVKQDMRAANAALCVIATAALPKGVEAFDRIDGVFVVSFRCVLPLAQVLRQVLVDIALIRAATKQDDDTAEQLFSYVTGEQFFHRLSAVLEGCIALQGDLDADKRATSRRWAQSQKHIDAVAQNMGAMFGDLQGLLGGTLRKLPGLTLNENSDSASMFSRQIEGSKVDKH
jgi:hypothetical protein